MWSLTETLAPDTSTAHSSSRSAENERGSDDVFDGLEYLRVVFWPHVLDLGFRFRSLGATNSGV